MDHLRQAADLLVEFMETGSAEAGARILDAEHRADEIKVRNLQTLSEAFSTPMDREDIYRAVIGLDEVVNYSKATVNEMDVLGVRPDKYELDMAVRIRDGVLALQSGYGIWRSRLPPWRRIAPAPGRRSAPWRKSIAAPWLNCFRATTTSTCLSAAKSTGTCPMPPTGWLCAPTRSSTWR